jgi:hypothetical protein
MTFKPHAAKKCPTRVWAGTYAQDDWLHGKFCIMGKRQVEEPNEWACGDCGQPVVGDWCKPCLAKLEARDEKAAKLHQVGGDHYIKYSIQPFDIIDCYGLNFYAGNALKYLLRYRDKGGVQDLEKARHYIDKLIETERA